MEVNSPNKTKMRKYGVLDMVTMNIANSQIA
jgi:hypothetical protein